MSDRNFFRIVGALAFISLIGLAFAAFTSSTVESCANRGGTVTINNCLGLNTNDSNPDISVAKNGIIGTTMSNYDGNGTTINSVSVEFKHGGQNNISGNIGVTFYDAVNGVEYCTENTSTLNTTAYTTSIVGGCTPSGGWDATKVDNLEVRLKNYDIGTSQRMFVSYLKVSVNYT